MLDDLCKIEIEHCVIFPVEHVEPHGIAPDLVDHLAQGYEFAGTLRHLHRLTGAQKAYQLHELYIEIGCSAAQRFDGRLHTLDVASVIGPPNVDQVTEAAIEFRFVISDVSRK